MFSNTDMSVNSAPNWNSMPISRRSAYSAVAVEVRHRPGRPRRPRPRCGRNCPPISRRIVVLPHPDPPMIATTLPRGIVIVDAAQHRPRPVVAERDVVELDGRRVAAVEARGRADRGGIRVTESRSPGGPGIVRGACPRGNDPRSVGGLRPRARQSFSRRASASARFSGRPSSTTTSPASKRQSAPAASSARRAGARRSPRRSRRAPSPPSVRPTAAARSVSSTDVQPRLQVVGGVGRVASRRGRSRGTGCSAPRGSRGCAASTRLSGTPSSSSECDGEHQAALEHLGHHFGRAGLEQPVEVGVVERAHDHRQLGPQLVHVVRGS